MPEDSYLVQYADDTFVFVATNCINAEITNLERILEKLIDCFKSYRLTLNAEKREFIVFSKPSKIPWCAIGSKPQVSERIKKCSVEKSLRYQKNLLCSCFLPTKPEYCY